MKAAPWGCLPPRPLRSSPTEVGEGGGRGSHFIVKEGHVARQPSVSPGSEPLARTGVSFLCHQPHLLFLGGRHTLSLSGHPTDLSRPSEPGPQGSSTLALPPAPLFDPQGDPQLWTWEEEKWVRSVGLASVLTLSYPGSSRGRGGRSLESCPGSWREGFKEKYT